MYDYIKPLRECITTDQLVDVFSYIAVLDEQAVCKDWVELIAALGVEGTLNLAKVFGGRSFQIPPFYQILVVFSALEVVQLMKTMDFEHAKRQVLGDLMIDGFEGLVGRIKTLADSVVSSAQPGS